MMAAFFPLALISLIAAFMVVTRKSALASAIYLILVMCCIAGLFATLGALFIAAMQIIVYAGAIMVLVIFVIMLLNLRNDEFGIDKKTFQKIMGFAVAAVILVQSVFILSWVIKVSEIDDHSAAFAEIISDVDGVSLDQYLSAESVAETLFKKYAYPFEVTSILLLAAIIGAMVISKKKLIPGEEEEEA